MLVENAQSVPRARDFVQFGRFRRGVTLVAAVVVLAGCAPETQPDWTPASWHIVGELVEDAPTDAPGTAATVALRARNDDVGIDARWAPLPGDQPVNAVIEAAVRGEIDARVAASGQEYHPQVFAAGAGLGERGCAPGATSRTAVEILGDRSGAVIVCEVTFARGDVFAETLRTVTGDAGTVASDIAQTYYADLSTGAVGTSADLFADTGALWIATVDTLRREMGSLSLAPVQAPAADQLAAFTTGLGGARFDEGTVLIPVPADLHAAELDGLVRWQARGADRRLYVAFAPSDVPQSLSDLGRSVAAASGDYTGPASRGAGFEHVPCDLVACMALTLDDGPSTLTPGFLDVLRDHQSAATFFMLGQNASRHPDTVARVAAEGHEVGNHTWDHPYLTDLTDAQVRAQLGDTRALLQRLSGQSVPVFRPPGGFVDDHVVELAGQSAILWSVDTRDWAGPDAESLARYAIDTPRQGSIMLMHDIQKVTAGVFDEVVAGLRDRGFQLVTVDEIFDGAVPVGIVRHAPIH